MNVNLNSLGNLGTYVPASFPIPQTPIILSGSWGHPASAMDGLGGFEGLGEYVPASFPIPQTPIILSNPVKVASNRIPAGVVRHGGGVGCACGSAGMGDVSSTLSSLGSSLSSSLSGDIMGVPTYLWVGGGAVLLFMLMSRGKSRSAYRSATSEARAKYRGELAKIRAEHPTGYGRIRRAASAF